MCIVLHRYIMLFFHHLTHSNNDTILAHTVFRKMFIGGLSWETTQGKKKKKNECSSGFEPPFFSIFTTCSPTSPFPSPLLLLHLHCLGPFPFYIPYPSRYFIWAVTFLFNFPAPFFFIFFPFPLPIPSLSSSSTFLLSFFLSLCFSLSSFFYLFACSWHATVFLLPSDGLRNYFSKFGDLVDCIVMKDPMTGRSR